MSIHEIFIQSTKHTNIRDKKSLCFYPPLLTLLLLLLHAHSEVVVVDVREPNVPSDVDAVEQVLVGKVHAEASHLPYMTFQPKQERNKEKENMDTAVVRVYILPHDVHTANTNDNNMDISMTCMVGAVRVSGRQRRNGLEIY